MSSSSSFPTIKTLLTSHVLIFLAGVYAGKQIDAEELEGYRSVHENASDKWKRRALKLTLGASALGVVVLGMGALHRKHQGSHTLEVVRP
mmetsp:Transcript_7315/g.9960  ORF Transcript_7315/g.9960 Transcript_7315/m.9960 type:complete len:90 (+) Transcript_7315:221-490(+)